MRAIFEALFGLHPVAPVVFLLIMANGLLAPAVLMAVAKLPYDIGKVRAMPKAGNRAAKYAYYSWLSFAAAALAAIAVLIAARLAVS
jgi:hypothetical protein